MIIGSQVVVGATPTLIASSLHGDAATPASTTVLNSGTVTVYLGGPGVATATGFPLAVGNTLNVDLRATNDLYGIVATGTNDVSVLQVGQ